MTRRNLSFLKRKSNRDSRLLDREDVPRGPISPLFGPKIYTESLFGLKSKLYVPSAEMDLEWQPTIGSVFKVVVEF